MNDFLTKSEQVVFIRFLNELEYLERGHYLAIIAVDTPALAGEITNQILQKKNNSTVLEYTGSVEILQSAFQNTGSDRSIRILNILALPTSKFGKALQQLNFQRDYITDFNLKIVLLCSHLFLQQMQTKAFDFVSIASFKVFFTDKQAAVAQSLQPVGQKPIEVMEFEEMDAELKKYRKLKNKDKELYLRKIFNTAYAAYEISRNDYSLQLYIEALHLATVLNNTKYISGINGNIGLIYKDKGDPDEALKFFSQALEIDKKIGYLQGQANQLGNIGIIYRDKGDLDEALKFFMQSLEIHKQIGYLRGQADALGNIGLIYNDKGDLDQALKFHSQALEIDKQIGYLQGQANQLGNIGLIYRDKGDLDEALKFFMQSLEIHKQIGYLQGQANQLGNIGLIYSDKGDMDEALKFLMQALEIVEKCGFLPLIKKLTNNLASVYELMNNTDEAAKYRRRAEEIQIS